MMMAQRRRPPRLRLRLRLRCSSLAFSRLADGILFRTTNKPSADQWLSHGNLRARSQQVQ